jgi:hypothetical protein
VADVAPDGVFQVAGGFMAAKLLVAADEVGLFERLARDRPQRNELAQRTSGPRRTTRRLVDAMVALRFADRQDGRAIGRRPAWPRSSAAAPPPTGAPTYASGVVR